MISCGGCIELYYAKHVGLLFEELFTCTIIDNNFGLEKSFEKSNRCGTCKPPVRAETPLFLENRRLNSITIDGGGGIIGRTDFKMVGRDVAVGT